MTRCAIFLCATFILTSFALSENTNTGKHCDNGVCEREEDKGPCLDDGNPKLFRWEPIRKGYQRELELEAGKTYTMTTVANKPPIFEIRNFLTPKECEHLKKLARKNGLHTSNTHFDEELLEKDKRVKGHAEGVAGYFASWNKNEDDEITRDEILYFALTYKYLYLTEEDVDEMIKKLDLNQFSDGKVTIEEFKTFPTASIDSYLNVLKAHHPRHKDRHSTQTWLEHGKTQDPIVKRLTERIIKLTRLPQIIIRGGELMQVVRYERNGHYNGHYDSQPTNLQYKCCQAGYADPPLCRLCRYATVLYYLNDVKDGGQTAFPAADVENYSEADLVKNVSGDVFNMIQNCKNAKLVVPAEKGKAILWYNHFVDEKNGYLGERDDYTVHGGCGVRKGQKWVANNWFTAPDAKNIDMLKTFRR